MRVVLQSIRKGLSTLPVKEPDMINEGKPTQDLSRT